MTTLTKCSGKKLKRICIHIVSQKQLVNEVICIALKYYREYYRIYLSRIFLAIFINILTIHLSNLFLEI